MSLLYSSLPIIRIYPLSMPNTQKTSKLEGAHHFDSLRKGCMRVKDLQIIREYQYRQIFSNNDGGIGWLVDDKFPRKLKSE